MTIIPLKTRAVIPGDGSTLESILDKYVVDLEEESVVLVTSKIVSICEGRFVKVGEQDKDALIISESEKYIPPSKNKFNIAVTIAHGIFGASAGIDESNANDYYILWPDNPQKSANAIRAYLRKKFDLKNLGVVITDSKTTPLRWGVTGISLAHSGFLALKDYIGTPDIFGREFQFEKLNIADSIATAGVLVMGEGNEQTPLAVATDIPTITFQDQDPSQEELSSLHISLDDDLFGEFLKNADWGKGGK